MYNIIYLVTNNAHVKYKKNITSTHSEVISKYCL